MKEFIFVLLLGYCTNVHETFIYILVAVIVVVVCDLLFFYVMFFIVPSNNKRNLSANY